MNNKILALLTALCLAAVLASCGNNTDSTVDGMKLAGGADTGGASNREGQSLTQDTDEEVLADGQEWIYGRVTSVVGNEVVLALGSYETVTGTEDTLAESQDEAAQLNPSGSDDNTQADNSSGTERPSFARGDKPSGEGTPPQEGTMPTGEMPEGGEFPTDGELPEGMTLPGIGGEAGGTTGTQGSTGAFTETGETQTLLVPVGLTVTGRVSGRTADYSAISSGMLLRVTVQSSAENGEIVTAVRVLSN